MKSLLLVLTIFGCAASTTAQTKSAGEVKMPKPKGNPTCVYKQKFNPTVRNKFYPFNIADTIKLVSFRYHSHNYPVKGDTLVVDSLIETKVLTKVGLDSLTDILYNNFYKKQPNYGSLTLCYFPRNAILFIDKTGKLKESILLCFHCRRHEQSSANVYFGDDCDEKMEKLRQFFISENVKFGIDRNVGIYSGEESDD